MVLLSALLPYVESACGGQPTARSAAMAMAVRGPLRWEPWRPETAASSTQRELRADLIRYVGAAMPVLAIAETFPLTGDLLGGGAFWAAVVVPESEVTVWMVLVFEHRRGGWREVARHELSYHIPGRVAPARIEPAHAWMVANGASGARAVPTWEVLRFDGEALHMEVLDGWFDVMLVDVDGDGTLEILGEHISHVNCYYCGITRTSFSLHRWDGVEMVEAGPETLPVGSASEPAMATNNRASELAAAGRWTEALAVIDGARALTAESSTFRRNAGLIDLHVGGLAAATRLSGDTLLHHVFAGAWTDAVEIFRHEPVLPDFFTTQPLYAEEYTLGGDYGRPPFLQAVFDATAAARRVVPARPEIEFLHGWSAYHLREWSASMGRNDPDAPAAWRMPMPNEYWNRIEAGDPVVREALDRAAALAPGDPFFVDAARVVAERADLSHADAMRRTFLLFDRGPGSCVRSDCTEWPRPRDIDAESGGMRWLPWRAPRDRGRPLAEAPDGGELSRLFASVYRPDRELTDDVRAFPLDGGRFDERSFWAVFDPSADTCQAHRFGVSIHYASECTAPVLAVYERDDGGWRAVTQRTVPIADISVVAPVEIESSQAWLVVVGVADYHVDANEPLWKVLRFDGESLHVEVTANWLDVMVVDIDGDGSLEILGSRRLCDECPVTRRAVRLFRWTGARLRSAPLAFLPAGSASDAAVATNNRAVALARARRWMEAVAVLDAARARVAESRVFRRNASLIDLNAGAGGALRLSEDALLHRIFAGSWADAVALFRGAPADPDLFAQPLPYTDEVGAPPFLRAIFDATAAARAVGPARAEIEFLHAWSAFHLDPDTTVVAIDGRDAEYRVDVDEASVRETLARAAVLAPGDSFFAEASRVAANRESR